MLGFVACARVCWCVLRVSVCAGVCCVWVCALVYVAVSVCAGVRCVCVCVLVCVACVCVCWCASSASVSVYAGVWALRAREGNERGKEKREMGEGKT